MLTRIQIRADGDTAHNIEDELLDAMAKTADALELAPKVQEQVIEGSPGNGFRGRLSFTFTEPPRRVQVEIRGNTDAIGVGLSAEKGKVSL